MKKVMKVCHRFGDILNIVAIIALVVMIVITIADVFLRVLFTAPITGAVEITRMMMVCMAPAFISALFERRHVSVGLFVDKLGRKGQLAFDTFGYLLSAILCGLMCYQGIVEMLKKIAQNHVYTMLKVPSWPFYLVFSVSMGFFAVAILIKLIDNYCDKDLYTHGLNAEEEGGAHE